ncbi:uncharacterized protein V2V93DRAFT_392069 [Kockiozyma suomiensis]|uniref:uncharacterized protein n=1 Tax=Kockiozyma suomiensis TaxID=1337062 RepID=UPI003343443A
MLLAFVVVLPVSVMLSIARSPLHGPVHVIFLALSIIGTVPAVIYKARVDDLYPGNVHSSFGWFVLFLLAVHFGAGFFENVLGWAMRKPVSAVSSAPHPHHTLASDDADADAAADRASLGSVTLDGHDDDYFLPCDDSADLYPSEFGYRYTDAADGGREYVLETADDLEKLSLPHHPSSVEYRVQHAIATYFEPVRRAVSRLPDRLLTFLYLAASVTFALLNRPLILIGFFQIMSGIVTATNLGMHDKIFGLLAHFIKGSVFFWFGILTFGRVLGAYANLGWAWNVRPPVPLSRQSLGARFFRCSMETVESGLIFFYGITNIFLEHLGNRDGKWSHKDLQHASIAFMYIGGGLCGLLFESSLIRSLFNASIRSKLPRRRITSGQKANGSSPPLDASSAARASSLSSRPASALAVDPRAAEPVQYASSSNPFPLFTVFFTGVLMSQHQQATELSTKIHMQWGYLLCIGAIFRAITYLSFFHSPLKSYLPARPMTEILTSFCLMAAGVIFVASSEQIVNAMLYHGLDGMFTMNVAVGAVALLMAWIMILMALKGWALQRRS